MAKINVVPASKVTPASLGADIEAEGIEFLDEQYTTDEFVAKVHELREEVATLKDNPVFERLKEAEVILDTELCSDLEPDEEHKAKYGALRVEIGKKGNTRTITDLPGMKKMMGEELFLEVAKVGLKEADDYLTPEQREEVISTERTGKRTIKIVTA